MVTDYVRVVEEGRWLVGDYVTTVFPPSVSSCKRGQLKSRDVILFFHNTILPTTKIDVIISQNAQARIFIGRLEFYSKSKYER